MSNIVALRALPLSDLTTGSALSDSLNFALGKRIAVKSGMRVQDDGL
jgi:hypothetical protein